jgi:hypothetical protein
VTADLVEVFRDRWRAHTDLDEHIPNEAIAAGLAAVLRQVAGQVDAATPNAATHSDAHGDGLQDGYVEVAHMLLSYAGELNGNAVKDVGGPCPLCGGRGMNHVPCARCGTQADPPRPCLHCGRTSHGFACHGLDQTR